MNATSIRTRIFSLIMTIFLVLPLQPFAQDFGETASKQAFSQEQLAQLLAPIALYPDELIAQVLMAATYPLEIVMADRWTKQNSDLKGDALAVALETETWDPSVKSLVNFPSVLAMLSQKLDLTTKLGDAFLEQQEDVMATIQLLRTKALATGNLKTGNEQKVVVQEEYITIEPATPQVIYVPTYDPYQVYGQWWFPDSPPYYFYPPLYPGSSAFTYGAGVSLGLAWGYAWGGWNWHNRTVFINVNRNVNYNRHIDRDRYVQHFEARGQAPRNGQVSWKHDPGHRRGVAYKHKETAREFGQLPVRRGPPSTESRGFSQPDRRSPLPRNEKRGDGRVVSPGTNRESIFPGSESNGNRARRSSERGRQSIGGGSPLRSGPASQPRREVRPADSGSGSSGGNRSEPKREGRGKGHGDNNGR